MVVTPFYIYEPFIHVMTNRIIVVRIVIRQQAGRPGFRIPARARYFSLLESINISPVAHVTYSNGTWILTGGKAAGT
jgi:hypothetical protein